MKLLCWNCRGLGQTLTVRTIFHLVYDHSPDILFLSETKTNVVSINKLFSKLGFSCYFGVDAIGFSGGLRIGWKSFLSLPCFASSPNFVFTSILDELGLFWFCGFIYGHPVLDLTVNVWSSLSAFISSNSGPLLLCGDFNQVLSPRDKWGKNSLLTLGSLAF